MHASYNHDVDLTEVLSVLSLRCFSQNPEEADVIGRRLAELSHMLYNGALRIVPDTHENLKGIAEHSSSINGDVELP